MPKYDAAVVFGTKLNTEGRFPSFVYKLIDSAVLLLKKGEAKSFIFCGSHSMKQDLIGQRECDVAWQYVSDSFSECLTHTKLEGRSTNIPENWLFLKTSFPNLRSIHLVTITPLLPRIQFLGDWIYGDDAQLSFTSLNWPAQAFSNERRLLQDAECTLKVRNTMRRGDHSFLLDGSKSRWNELRLDHHNCPFYGDLHH